MTVRWSMAAISFDKTFDTILRKNKLGCHVVFELVLKEQLSHSRYMVYKKHKKTTVAPYL